MPPTLPERASRQDTGPILPPKFDVTEAQRAADKAIANRMHKKNEGLRVKTKEYDAAALAKVRAEVERTKSKPKDEATLAIEEAIEALDVSGVKRTQREIDTAKWDSDKTQPMMRAAEKPLTEMDRALGEAKGMEERLKSAGIDPDELAAGKVGLWKRLTHSQLIHDWHEANKAVAELAPKGGVDRRAEQSAGRRARIAPPRPPRSPLGLG